VLYGVGALAALAMAILGAQDARLPWAIVTVFCGGSFIETLRDKPPLVS
jgi:hypothetical protein